MIGTMSFTAGGYFGYAGISDRQSSGGRTASPLTEQPQPLGIRWIPATAATAPAGTPAATLAGVTAWNGKPVQLTNPEGFTALGVGYLQRTMPDLLGGAVDEEAPVSARRGSWRINDSTALMLLNKKCCKNCFVLSKRSAQMKVKLTQIEISLQNQLLKRIF